MKDVTKLFLLTLGLGMLARHSAHAQLGVGTGTTAPRTMLDVNGALALTEATAAVSANAATIPTGFGLVRLTGSPTATVALTPATTPAPVAGQHLVVVNPTAQPATLAGQSIAAGQALAFVYSNGGWVATAGKAGFYSADGTLTDNRAVTMGANNLLFNATTGYIGLNGNTNNTYRVELQNTNSGTNANTRLGLNNDIGNAFLFLNSSTRTFDGGVNTLTLRNNVGDLRLQSQNGAGLTVAATTGLLTASNLAGTGLRSVMADASGVLSAIAQTAANTPNLYTADGSLTGSRTVAMGANNLTFGSTAGRTVFSGNSNSIQGLDVINASSGTAAHTRIGLTNDVGTAYLYLNSSTRVDGSNGFNALTLRNNVGDLRLQSQGGAGLTVAAATGNLGVNTAAPTYTLDVTGTAHATGMTILNTGLVIDNNNGNTGTLTSGNTSNNHITFGMNSGEAIGSARSGTNTMGLDFYTQFAKRMSITQGGYVGIGTATPAYPLDVATVGGNLPGNYAFYAFNGLVNTGVTSNTSSVSIRAAGRIAASEFNALSDARLKTVTGLSDNQRDLGLLRQIEITDYQMKDKVQYGNRAFKKVIAQQVEKVYPLAVNKGTGFVPSIYSTSTVAPAADGQSLVTLVAPHRLQVGDKVRMIGEKNGTVETTVMAVSGPRSFAVALPQPETKLFVFGPEVKDLRTVDYEALSMLNVSATQELAKQVEALKAANAQLTAANASLKASLDDKASASTLGEMQAALQALRAEVQVLKGAGITASTK